MLDRKEGLLGALVSSLEGVVLSGQKDSWVWNPDPIGGFLVTSVYDRLSTLREVEDCRLVRVI